MSNGERRAKLAHARWRTGTLARAGHDRPAAPGQVRPDGPGRPPLRRHADDRALRWPPSGGPRASGWSTSSGSLTWGELGQTVRRAGRRASPRCVRRRAARSGRSPSCAATTAASSTRSRAATKLGADALLLNTGFSGPQLADVVAREKAELVIYDEEFAGLVEHARSRGRRPGRAGRLAGPTRASGEVRTPRGRSSRAHRGADAGQARAVRHRSSC